jgi:hypothetical protein
MQEAIRAIKAVCQMIVMPDVALDPYSIWSRRYYRKWRCSKRCYK